MTLLATTIPNKQVTASILPLNRHACQCERATAASSLLAATIDGGEAHLRNCGKKRNPSRDVALYTSGMASLLAPPPRFDDQAQPLGMWRACHVNTRGANPSHLQSARLTFPRTMSER